MADTIQHWYLHVDLDAFFASVEQLDHPEYRGKPVIVGGKPDDRRSVVSTASYEARKYGVHSAMPTAKAYKLCPQGIYVHGRMERYSQISYSIMSILKNYSPDVLQMSIDEAFLDITGTEKIFGPPEETAYKIKNEIKEKTGLTVSVGLAQSKYFAKIASDINKPDGFYFVEPGKEEEFILNLPLKKVFGVGEKSLENLNKVGIITTRDIHEKSLESLQFLCGKNQGQFLYDIVRGKCEDRFGKESKSHSISSETTFPYDVTDEYTLETTLLNLAYGLKFRLLKENGFSRTVMVKIRYEDFSTVSIQHTYTENIFTIDDLYSKAKELFLQKWEYNRGVRLLGLGLENIESEDKPYQQGLFDDGHEKKEKVEKAILDLSKKHPEIKIHKARMLQSFSKNIKLFILGFIALSTLNKNLFAQEKENTKPLFNYEITGFWDSEVSYSLLSTFGNNTSLSFSSTLPVFKQEVELSSKIHIGNGWSFFMDFAENFDKNTIAIKYDGNKYLKNFTFSNRNIVFPSYYSSKLLGYNPGGGQTQSPGISFHFIDYENNKFQGDLLLRYDLTASKTATFYGKNKVTDINIPLSNYVYGKTYVIPFEKYISSVAQIYVENENGEYKDNSNKKYKKVSKADYFVIINQNLLIFTEKAGTGKNNNKIPQILVTFDSELNETDFGTYDDEETFLGEIQSLFSSSQSNIKVQNFYQNLTTTIEGKKALIIQSNNLFSPFMASNNYDFGMTANSEAFVTNKTTNEKSSQYYSKELYEDFTALTNDFFSEKHNFAQIYNQNQTSTSMLSAINRYPFADAYPLLYLTGSDYSDLAVLKRSYTPVSNFDIGKNAENASVRVLINGIETTAFSYSQTSGFVTINQSVNDQDKITISWNEESPNINYGFITGAAGFVYKINDFLTTDISLSTKLPFSVDLNYSNAESSFSSYVALSSGLLYKTKNLTVQDALSLSVENDDITGTYIANDLYDSKLQTFYLSQDNGYKSNNIPKLNCESGNTISLEEKKKSDLLSVYGETDLQITGYKIPLRWEFTEDQNWTSIDIKLNDSIKLSNTNKIEFAIKNESLENLSNYKLFIQLGIQAGDEPVYEPSTLIPTWDISQVLTLENNSWQIINIELSAKDQAFLATAKDARFIIIKTGGSQTSGKISIGPYEPKYNGIYTTASDNILCYSGYENDTGSASYKNSFSGKTLYSDVIQWIYTDSLTNEKTIYSEKFINTTNYENYDFINFDFAYLCSTKTDSINSNNPVLIYTLEDSSGNISLQLELSQNLADAIISSNKIWHTISVNKTTEEVFLDSNPLEPDLYELILNNSTIPYVEKININLEANNSLITQGSFYNGNTYFTQSSSKFLVKNIFSASYKTDGAIFSINDFPVLKDGFIHGQSIQKASFGNNIFCNLDGTLSYGIKIPFFSLKNDLSFIIQDDEGKLRSLTYSINNLEPIFGFLIFNESYAFSPEMSYSKKEDNFSLNFNNLKIPLILSFSTAGSKQQYTTKQQYKTNTAFTIPVKTSKIETIISASAEQKSEKIKNSFDSSLPTDFSSLNALQFSDGKNSENRNINLQLETKLVDVNNKFNPKINFKLANQFNSINKNENISSGNLAINLPFTINKHNLSFSYSRSAVINQDEKVQNSYGEDFSYLFTTQQNNMSLYTSIPFYELFDNKIEKTLENSSLLKNSYSSKYEFNWNRALFNNQKDIFIPKAASFAVTRDTSYTGTISDIYQLKGSVNFSFLNMLSGTLNNFKQDEYTSNFTIIVKIPVNEKITFLFSGYENLLLYKDSQNTFRTSADYKISDSSNWQIRLSQVWNHSGKDSIILYIPKLFITDFDSKDKTITRRESFNFAIGQNNNKFAHSYEFIHYCETTIQKKININASLGTTLSFAQDKATSLNLQASIGAKLKF